ncbi:MAG: hypothetical protein LBP78_01005 [Acidaminococcales bacterium]|jgi:hypothetical protein|nr:hypothetical protein [Acidaminococcales bacterium]
MAQIRRKTAYANFQPYFRWARENGLLLSWDRYEQSLPQDGFARLGLFCADCLLGPCRLNPFAPKEQKTVCGFLPDDLVYRTIMRLLGEPATEEDQFSSIIDAARRFLDENTPSAAGRIKVGPGVLALDKVNICVHNPTKDLLQDLCAPDVKLSTLGKVLPGYDAAASFCDSEFALLTGLVDALLLDERGVSLMRGAVAEYHTVILDRRVTAETVLLKARAACKNRNGKKTQPAGAPVDVKLTPLADAARNFRGPLALIGGGGNIKQTVDALSLNLMQKLTQSGVSCIIAGEAVAAIAKYGAGDSKIAYSADNVTAILQFHDRQKHIGVFLPEITDGIGLAEAIALAAAGFRVFTATELPFGNGDLGEKLASLLPYYEPDLYAEQASAFFHI